MQRVEREEQEKQEEKMWRLGEGSFGMVYREGDVAVKRLDGHGDMGYPGVHVLALQECSMRIRSQNLLQLLDVCAGGRDLVYELATEGNLASSLDVRGEVPGKGAKDMKNQILCGLRVLHSYRICHRDLKPSNMLLFDGGRLLKLGNYGSCCVMCSSACLTGVVQTLGYRTPEVLCQSGYGFGVDLWSVGMTFVERWTLHRPFPERTELEVLLKIYETVPGLEEMPKMFKTRSKKKGGKGKGKKKKLLDDVDADNFALYLLCVAAKCPSALMALRHPFLLWH